jgi:phenylalanyl-tRNA synthetase beta chain
VDVGDAEPLTIVCGAPNVAKGQKVAVAQVGTVLPGDFKIKKSKIRGVASRGMICSVRELELGDEHDGIWVLPDDAVVGKSVAEALGIEDHVIEIDNKSLTHRPDLWGHRGIAGEVAAIYRRPLKPLDCTLPSTGQGKPYPVRVEAPGCSRYLGLLIEGAHARPSPDWLRWLLLAVGQRPIDAIVDLSNFVMLDLGQPNHTFDATRLDAISTEGIVVRNARANEKMTTLDDEQRALDASDLLICCGDAPVALAGIMGGEESKVGDDTQRLLLEIATFDAATVRRTSSRLGIRTESSARFEKSLDPTLPLKAAGHFARLLAEIQPDVSLPAPLSDAGEWTDPAAVLRLRSARVREALGAEISDDEIVDILVRLGFEIEAVAQEPGVFSVGVASARSTKDVTIEQDLIEEVGRIFRYGNIPEQTIRAEITPPPFDPRRDLVRRIQDRLAGTAHFNEALSYSFVPDELIEQTGQGQRPHVAVHNPMAQDEARIRRAVAPSLLATLAHNRRNRDDVRLFEIGKGYHPESASENGEPLEVHEVALVWASVPPVGKDAAAFGRDRFSQLYGVVSDLLEFLGMPQVEWAKATSPQPWNHPGRCLEGRLDGTETPAAVVANIEPGLARALGLEDELSSDVAVAEISIDTLLQATRKAKPFRSIARFPGVKLDVAIDLPEPARAADLVAAIEASGKGHVANIELFDVYRGKNVDTGRKSLAYHVLLQSDKKTLTDKDQARFLKKLEKNLETLDARLRK